MAELHWNMGWTLATLGLCWLVLSCAVALALGQIIRRGKGDTAEATAASAPEEASKPWQPTLLASEEELPELQTGSRQASGTRLKPVRLDNETAAPARKVS